MAAVLLLGKDDVIRDILPAYETDAILRRNDVDRYDDREAVQTNLIDSYDRLIAFGRKHLPDPFFLEGEQRKSLLGILLREMISNLMIHREFTSSYQAKFVIEKDRMYTQNANRASWEGLITPENMEPNPKNPIIASFFRNIGLADRLGSGVRNLFGYSKFYSGRDPIMQEKDIFTITVPLKGMEEEDTRKREDGTLNETLNTLNGTLNETLKDRILNLVKTNAFINQSAIAKELGVSLTTIKREMKTLQESGLLIRKGAKKDGEWLVKKPQ